MIEANHEAPSKGIKQTGIVYLKETYGKVNAMQIELKKEKKLNKQMETFCSKFLFASKDEN